MWIGNGGGTGTFNQTAGSTTVNNWFAVGRDVDGANGATGTVNLSGGTITKNGGGNSYLGENTAGKGTMTISNNASFTATVGGGEFWVGQGGGTGLLTVQDTASLTVNNWLAVGRDNNASVGTVNLNGGSITQKTNGFLTIASLGTGTFNANAGTLNASQTYLGERGTMSGTLNANGSAITLGPTIFANAGTVTGTLNLNAGTVTANGFTANNAGGTGKATFNFNGGTLLANIDNTNFIGAKVTSVVAAGGAKISSNGHTVTIGSALTHDATIIGADGGLTKSGLGKLTLTGANTYTGATTVTDGTVQATSAAYATILNASNGGLDMQKGKFIFDYTGTTSPVAQVKSILTAGYPSFTTGQIRSTTRDAGTTLGYGDNGTNNVTVMVTLAGDANLSGTVDFNDFLILQNNFGNTGTRFDQGNFNYDGQTDFNDFLALQNNFGQSVNGSPVSFTSAQVAAITAFSVSDARLVPEPASLAVLAGLGAALTGRRRRRSVA